MLFNSRLLNNRPNSQIIFERNVSQQALTISCKFQGQLMHIYELTSTDPGCRKCRILSVFIFETLIGPKVVIVDMKVQWSF